MIRYSNDAESDLGEISDYTTDHWGKEQAHRYIAEIVQCAEQIERTPGIGRACFDIHPGLYRTEQGQHVIFYLPDPQGIIVCRVLHKRRMVEYENFLASFSESIE